METASFETAANIEFLPNDASLFLRFMKNIKNIIFDLGGVFIGINYSKTEKAFAGLGVKNFKDLYSQHHASFLFEQLETGKISPAEFCHEFRRAAKVNLSDSQIEAAWNAMLGKFFKQNVQWLQTIKQRCNIFLFSNTNIIHYNAFQKIYNEEVGGQPFDDHFIRAYYSHDLGLRKPYPEAFEAMLERENLMAPETLFIDDTLQNIRGAQIAGLQTIHLYNPDKLIAEVSAAV